MQTTQVPARSAAETEEDEDEEEEEEEEEGPAPPLPPGPGREAMLQVALVMYAEARPGWRKKLFWRAFTGTSSSLTPG